ncbi:hypothetical protein VOLCADRAFT_86273 [Volvox carteri f. nagariensis]|uniref:Glycosyl hydrolase family 32 N-terminal domain-containing protein n=1 Tax=Volvox carteri f. nagariensis TaxID=3068 RepID=D8TIC6_VOLCA|nr:uncharacterized protein VOLCADRAFT_86273 [Volvox carteri f. nagariensis]EFJ53217.1 hypothetical protein VOLCADRAFT_86273 [Volvox carteri f. nagariensis]|eukprot:XP_002946222.1 hypothetical protein VOLCADRAFT_86273 [Volvox carteri f. nagariensis]
MALSCLGSSAAIESSPTADPPSEPLSAGLVFGLGALGSWDEAAVGSPVVRCYVGDNEQRWFMWYSGRRSDSPAAAGVDVLAPSSGSIGVAVSRDGIRWSRGYDIIEGARGSDAAGDVGTIMGPNGDWWTFDTCHLAPADVQVLSNSSVSSGVGVYWMFYSGGDFEPVMLPEGFPSSGERRPVEGLRLRPGLAMSQVTDVALEDGRNWARIEADHHTGALFEVGTAQGEAALLFNGSMQVLAVGPRDMRMYYTAYDTSRRRFVVALATSPDGFKWTQKGVVFDPAAIGGAAAVSDDEDGGAASFDALGPAALSVVRDIDNRQFLMYYEAVATDNRRSIGLAVSKDGTSWRRYPAAVLEPATEPSPSGSDPWDGGDVGSPCAVSMSAGRWRLYYGGRKQSGQGPWQGIGLALSLESGPTFEGVPVQYKRRAAKPQPAT